MTQIRPVEVIHEKDIAGESDLIKMLRNSPIPPVFTSFAMTKCPSSIKTILKIEKIIG